MQDDPRLTFALRGNDLGFWRGHEFVGVVHLDALPHLLVEAAKTLSAALPKGR